MSKYKLDYAPCRCGGAPPRLFVEKLQPCLVSDAAARAVVPFTTAPATKTLLHWSLESLSSAATRWPRRSRRRKYFNIYLKVAPENGIFFQIGLWKLTGRGSNDLLRLRCLPRRLVKGLIYFAVCRALRRAEFLSDLCFGDNRSIYAWRSIISCIIWTL